MLTPSRHEATSVPLRAAGASRTPTTWGTCFARASGCHGVDDLTSRFIAAYLSYVCQSLDINEIEGYRRYQTDPKFKAGIDGLANVALSVLTEDDVETLNVDLFHDAKVPPEKEPMWDAFREGLQGS